jgi:hypothetical protein
MNMSLKKDERKLQYKKIMGLMLRGENKKAFDALCCLCGVDTGLFIFADYDEEVAKLKAVRDEH